MPRTKTTPPQPRRKRASSSNSDAARTTRTAGAFRAHVEAALEQFGDAIWLGEHSPLAAPYLLGPALANDPEAHTSLGRGRTLQSTLLAAAQRLPAKAGNYNPQRLLKITYFQPDPNRTQAGYATDLELSPATYYRHRSEAIAQLEQALSQQLRPSLRLEMPTARNIALIGRERLLEECFGQLRLPHSVALVGGSGLGKTSFGAALAGRWGAEVQGSRGAQEKNHPRTSAPPHVFWFTLRAGINDHLGSLLFSLGHFFAQRNAPQLWLQLAANKDQPDFDLALSLLRDTLSTQKDAPPLLCFDEVDVLRPHDTERADHARMRAFLEGISDAARDCAPTLFIGQNLLIDADAQVTLVGLTTHQVAAMLDEATISLNPNDTERLCEYTRGNPLLVRLFIALHQTGESLTDSLHRLPTAPSLHLLLDRVLRYLAPAERAVLMALSVYPAPAPTDAFGEQHAALNALTARGLIQADEVGGITLQPALREVAEQHLSAEDRAALHVRAAEVRAAHGEYTASAWHFVEANQPALAVWTWFTHREREILSGQAGAALAIFSRVSRDALPHDADRKALVTLRSELRKFTGEADAALDDLRSVRWSPREAITARAQTLTGDFLEAQSQIDAALAEYRNAVQTLNGLTETQLAQAHIKTARFRMQRQHDFAQAEREVGLARHEIEFLMGDLEDERGNYDAARAHLHLAINAAEHAGYAFGVARAHSTLAIVEGRVENVEAAVLHFDEALRRYEQIGEYVRLHHAKTNLAFTYIQARQFEASISPATEALRFFEKLGQAYWIAINASNLAEAYLGMHKLAEAEQCVLRAMSQEEDANHAYELTTLGHIRRAQRRFAEAEAAFREAIAQARQSDDPWAEAPAMRGLGEALRDHKREADARAQLQIALAMYEKLGLPKEIERTRSLL